MNANVKNKKDEFLSQIDILFESIKEWSSTANLEVSSSEININEEAFGPYNSLKLSIKNSSGKEIAQIIPIGASIIGANGRVDIKGLYDNIIIVLLNKGGPKITITTMDGDKSSTESTPFYKGIDEDGWYWIEDKRDKGHLFNAELFFELLSEISDYESK